MFPSTRISSSHCSYHPLLFLCLFFFFNDTATTEIYTLSLHDALPISRTRCGACRACAPSRCCAAWRSEEHTSELQSRPHLVCRLLLEKKKKGQQQHHTVYKTKKKKNKDPPKPQS